MIKKDQYKLLAYKNTNKLNNFNLELFNTFNKNKTLSPDVYSLKTFYDKYPLFNYQYYISYTKSYLEEVKNIIKWFNDGCNYDFLGQKDIVKKKSILIYTEDNFNFSIGGLVVQYYLGQLLDEMGQQVRIRAINNIKNPIFNNYYDDDLDLNNTIVVYGEGVKGNPKNAKYIVRWMLSQLGTNFPSEILNTWNKNELVYYFNSEIKIFNNKEKIGTIYKYLTTLYINPQIKNHNIIKKGWCFTLRKSFYHKNIKYIHSKDAYKINQHIKQEEFINVFNKYKYFVSYDPLTFLINIATLCGCVSIVYPIDGLDKIAWIKMTGLAEYFDKINQYDLYGVAYGNSKEEIYFAENTMHLVSEQWTQIIKYYKDTHISNFIKDINDFENMKNTISNNF